jgi:menaquinone-dependent protoporphyrinogen IX oxidase
MEKVWFIHNTKFGNSEKLANELAEKLKSNFEVEVGNIKEVDLKVIGNDKPIALVLAARIVAFQIDAGIRKFLKKLTDVLAEPIPKVAVFYTHASPWADKKKNQMEKALKKATCIGEICPEYLEVRMQKIEGPAEEGYEPKVDEFAIKLTSFIQS